MADLYGINYEKSQILEPKQLLDVNAQHGRIRHAYDRHVFVANVFGTTDVLYLCKIPKGARVVDVEIYCGDGGTTGAINVGHSAGAEGVEAADDDAFIAAGAITSAFNVLKLSTQTAKRDGLGKVFSEDVFLTVIPSTATDAAAGIELLAFVSYVID